MINKQLFFLIIISLSIINLPISLSQDYQSDENTLALWHFNRISNNSNKVIDSGPNNYYTTEIKLTKKGIYGESALFNNYGHTYMSVTPSFPSINSSIDFTIELYFLMFDKGDKIIISQLDKAPLISIRNNKIRVESNGFFTSNQEIELNKWTHISLTYNNPYFTIYINGKKDTKENVGDIGNIFTGLDNGNSPLIIGKNLDGLIDELRISNIARTKFNINQEAINQNNITKDWIIQELNKEHQEKINEEKILKEEIIQRYNEDEREKIFQQEEINKRVTEQKKRDGKNAKIVFWLGVLFSLIFIIIYKEVQEKKRLKEEIEIKMLEERKNWHQKSKRLTKKEEDLKEKDKDYQNFKQNTYINQKLETEKEVKDFWEDINSREDYETEDLEEGVHITSSSHNLFRKFISNTKRTLDITTNVFSHKDLIELLSPIKNKNIQVRIITARQKDEKYKIKEFFKDKPLKIEITPCKDNHSKMMIRDNEKMILGSSNLDRFSLENALETNILTSDIKAINTAKSLIDSIIEGKESIKIYENNKLLYSGIDKENLPYILKKLLSEEDKEIVILLALQLFNIQNLRKLQEWNINNVKIRIILSNSWLSGKNNSVDKETYEFLKNFKEENNIEISFKKEIIHSKVYILKGLKKALISSMNMTPSSWSSLFEVGYLVDEEIEINKILDKIMTLEDKEIEQYTGLLEETKEVPSVWKQRKFSENNKKIPWKLPEELEEFKFEKDRMKVYKIKVENNRFYNKREKVGFLNNSIKKTGRVNPLLNPKTAMRKMSKNKQKGIKNSPLKGREDMIEKYERTLKETDNLDEKLKTQEKLEWLYKKREK